MKPTSLFLAAAAASILGASPALAQDVPPPPPAPDASASPPSDAPPPSTPSGIDPAFTGPRVEGFGGVDFLHRQFSPFPSGFERNHTGGVAGVLGGFDFGFRNFVVGGFGTFALPTTNACGARPAGVPDQCVREGREIEGGGRIGFKGGDSFFGNRAMVYVKGSYVNSSIRVQSTFTSGGTYNTYRLVGGIRGGAGLEYAVSNHAYVKAEYDYTRTGRIDLSPYGLPGTSYRQTKNQVLAGFGVRF